MSADPIRGHSYDGIEEFDNRLPNWWLWTFYATIVWGIAWVIIRKRTEADPTLAQQIGINHA